MIATKPANCAATSISQGVKEVAGYITPVPGGVGPNDHHDAAGPHDEAAEREAAAKA